MATDAARDRKERRWLRHHFIVPVRVVLRKPRQIIMVNGSATEMNEGGMAVCLGMAVDIGEEVEVEFAPRNAGVPLRVGGIVRGRSGCIYGIEFMPAEGRETQVVASLRDFLRRSDGDAHTLPDWLSTTAT